MIQGGTLVDESAQMMGEGGGSQNAQDARIYNKLKFCILPNLNVQGFHNVQSTRTYPTNIACVDLATGFSPRSLHHCSACTTVWRY